MIKHKKPVPIFCPRCASPEIKLSSSLDYWLTPRKYICPKCGYTGILVMELEEDRDIQEKNSEISDKQKEATNKCI
ncbi:MAG: hypothetical protein GX638_05080 [Crenarchaeota archaeon]|nr:hypothetical protein [Thermoproteota archaeon]